MKFVPTKNFKLPTIVGLLKFMIRPNIIYGSIRPFDKPHTFQVPFKKKKKKKKKKVDKNLKKGNRKVGLIYIKSRGQFQGK